MNDNPPARPVSLRVNGTDLALPLEARVSLLDALRDHAGLPGTKKGCNQGACGACTVLLDGERVLSCLTLAVQCEGREVTTIEGLGSGTGMHPLQHAFIEHDGFQCGYCTPGHAQCGDATGQSFCSNGIQSRGNPGTHERQPVPLRRL